MQTIMVHTLFDITNTDVVRNYKPILVQSHQTINTEQDWYKARRQQTNFDTLIQVLSLRAQPTVLFKPKITKESLSPFGINKKGKVWSFAFTVDFDGVYFNGIDNLGLLKDDIEHVPMISNLTESIHDEYLRVDKNIRFELNDV